MSEHWTPATRRLGIVSAGAVAGLASLYAIALVAGLLSLPAPDAPIGDPFFTVMELLIVAMAPFLIGLAVALRAFAPPRRRRLALAAILFMALLVAITTPLHALILVLNHGPPIAALEPWRDALSFRWPSLAYALDILAWDVCFPLAALAAAPAFEGTGVDRAIRALLVWSALLALAGLAGPWSGDMRLRDPGILGYAGLFPAAAALAALLFARTRPWRTSASSTSAAQVTALSEANNPAGDIAPQHSADGDLLI